MNPCAYINDWQCSINILNATVYRRFQHASLHNPIKNTSFSLPKKNSPLPQKGQTLFKNAGQQYKLPIVRTYRKKLQEQKQNIIRANMNDIKAGQLENKRPTLRQLETPARESVKWNRQLQFKTKFQRFRDNLEGSFNLGERDRYFSYLYNVVGEICASIQKSENKQEQVAALAADIEILAKNIDANLSVLNTLKKITVFKRNSQYFQFKKSHIRLLYHILLAQLEFYEKNLQKCIAQFQFCEYYSRKQGHENLTLSLLWEMANLNISLLKYDKAGENLRNLLEMAVICKQKKAIKYALEKISVIYYYRGNSIMGQYYLKKSDKGLTPFEVEMFSKQYNRNDELKRLQHKLFNLPLEDEQIVKRKNNPKLESDAWKESKEDHEKNMDKYMDSVNQMLKDHEHAKLGRQIKKIARRVNVLGFFTKISKANEVKSPISAKQEDNRKSLGEKNECEPSSIFTIRNSQGQLKKPKQSKSIKQILSQTVQDNVTKVIKTHLSMNRENTKINREHRWRKLINFIFMLQSSLLQLMESEGTRQTITLPTRTVARLKTLTGQNQ